MSCPTFDALNLPLEGRVLVEASAGTGKTYGIVTLFLRLIAIEKVDVQRVLILTFTKAATAELKIRLRLRLAEMITEVQHVLQNPARTINPQFESLVQVALQSQTVEELHIRLMSALQSFDNSSIYTIHGFCQRVLQDYAFLCGTPFQSEQVASHDDFIRQSVEDFWRETIAGSVSASFLALQQKQTPATWLAKTTQYIGNLSADIAPEPAGSVALFEAELSNLQDTWRMIEPQLIDIKVSFERLLDAGLNRTSFKLESFCRELDSLQVAGDFFGALLVLLESKNLLKLSFDKLKFNKNATPNPNDIAKVTPLGDFAGAAHRLSSTIEIAWAAYEIRAAHYVREQLHLRAKTANTRSFDDLISYVARALSSDNPQQTVLAQTLANEWQFALIDEFQDTDPLQYRIFTRIFSDQNRALLMIGDPKQAIYRFRGADIHAYLQAASEVEPEKRYSMTTNYRTGSGLLQAVGELFARPNPFSLPEITFTQVEAAKSNPVSHEKALTVRQIIPLEAKEATKEFLNHEAALWCADEVALILNEIAARNRQRLPGDKLLSGGDIAVLVRTAREGEIIQHYLQTRKQGSIAAISTSRESIFASEEARAMRAMLSWFLAPEKMSLLRLVVSGWLFYDVNVTPFATFAALFESLNSDVQVARMWVERAQKARHIWQKTGNVFSAIHEFSRLSGLETGLLAANRERSLTNFYQLSELLGEAMADYTTPESLLNWFSDACEKAANGDHASTENEQLRLESDENLVKIVTIHASKGLEYEYVICPFAWNTRSSDTSNAWRMTGQQFKPQSLMTDEEKHAMLQEDLAEELRLYYVAFTRARYRLILYSAVVKTARSNNFHHAIDYLLDQKSEISTPTDWGDTIEAHRKLAQLWQAWEKRCSHAFYTTCAPESVPLESQEEATCNFEALQLERYVSRKLPVQTSFSALTHERYLNDNAEQDDVRADDDIKYFKDLTRHAGRVNVADTTLNRAENLAGLGRGATLGLAVHEMLEKTDFAQSAADNNTPPSGETLGLYDKIVRAYGLMNEGKTLDTQGFLRTIDVVRTMPIWPGETLSNLPKSHSLAEMDFMLAMDESFLPRIKTWLESEASGLPAVCREAAKKLDWGVMSGYLKGYIDLVAMSQNFAQVAVIDYKSNYLGDSIGDYHTTALNHAVAHSHYYLQAALYAIALARFLQLRDKLPATLSVRYWFLRGLQNGATTGVWAWDIDSSQLQAWLIAPT